VVVVVLVSNSANPRRCKTPSLKEIAVAPSVVGMLLLLGGRFVQDSSNLLVPPDDDRD
jgi:hypothetical protein